MEKSTKLVALDVLAARRKALELIATQRRQRALQNAARKKDLMPVVAPRPMASAPPGGR